MDMRELIRQAEALKRRKIEAQEFTEASEIRDHLKALGAANDAMRKLEILVEADQVKVAE